MRVTQSSMLNNELLKQAQQIGAILSRIRIARGMKQSDLALRAGMSRNTVYRMEMGDPGVAFGQLLRYIDVLAPGMTLQDVLNEKDPTLIALAHREQTRRVRGLSAKELKEMDF